LMMSLWDALRMNMMISYQELVRTFPFSGSNSITCGLTRSIKSSMELSRSRTSAPRSNQTFIPVRLPTSCQKRK
ncbi:hypothetical protein BL177_00012485, partial [Klebsiella pneumoniae]